MKEGQRTLLAQAILAELKTRSIQPKKIAINFGISGAYVCQIGCRNKIRFRNPRKKS